MPDSGTEESSKREVCQVAAEDPLLVFGSEILTIILAKLDLRSLAEVRLVSRGWQAVASSDRIWGPKDFCLIFRPSPKSLSASMSRENLPFRKSGIASYGELTANAEWREDGEEG
ncbi:hypothetical protein AAHA92_16569 [Salvia divinorum]|uniref:F-box domain-containing protein n=1 Tax=Salvia divinorum TaxID=28513 RepID=A0ABD1GVZ3_SALDI